LDHGTLIKHFIGINMEHGTLIKHFYWNKYGAWDIN